MLNCQEFMAESAAFENLIGLLQKCRKKKNLLFAKHLHGYMGRHKLDSHHILGNYLVPMLVDCGSLSDAQQAFNKLACPNEYSWSSLIAAYVDSGEFQHAFNLYHKMRDNNIKPMSLTFVVLLRACARLKNIERGWELHMDIIKEGFDRDIVIGNTLVDMYCKCDSLVEAHQVFDKLPVHDGVSWNVLISGYAKHGYIEEALRCSELMQLDPNDASLAWSLKACGNTGAIERGDKNSFTYVALLKACRSQKDLEKGQILHAEIIGKALERDPFVANTLLDMYCKFSLLVEAQKVFDKLRTRDRISWNILITGYADHECDEVVLKCLEQMQLQGVPPDDTAFVCSLKACGSMGALETGRKMHTEIVRRSLDNFHNVGNMLVDMYVKCGLLQEGREVFNNLPVRDVVSWTAMIKGYGENHEVNMSIQCFEDMQQQGVKPNAVTFTCLLAACSHANMVVRGQEYFGLMKEKYQIEPTSDIYACMVDLFARSGHVYEAERFAQAMQCLPSKENLKSLLSACKMHGEVELGLRCFQQLVLTNQEDPSADSLMADICST